MDDDAAADRVRASFARQGAMGLLGAKLARVFPGLVEIALPYREDLAQQHGFFHGGIVSAVLDSACGYAALSRMPADRGVLTVEFKISFVAAASGDRLFARGRVVKSGRTLVFCDGEALVPAADGERVVATMTATMMAVHNRPGVQD